MDEKWTVFRRYSRFLEMHRGLKLKYPEVRDASPRRRSSSFAAISSVLTSTRPPSLPPPQLAALEFPPKKLFGNRDERMVAERRNHLEAKTTSIKSHFARVGRIANFQRLFVCSSQRYLRNLFRVMLSSSGSPLWDGGLRLTKHAVCEFSPFFKKGVFEYSSHGTG